MFKSCWCVQEHSKFCSSAIISCPSLIILYSLLVINTYLCDFCVFTALITLKQNTTDSNSLSLTLNCHSVYTNAREMNLSFLLAQDGNDLQGIKQFSNCSNTILIQFRNLSSSTKYKLYMRIISSCSLLFNDYFKTADAEGNYNLPYYIFIGVIGGIGKIF